MPLMLEELLPVLSEMLPETPLLTASADCNTILPLLDLRLDPVEIITPPPVLDEAAEEGPAVT